MSNNTRRVSKVEEARLQKALISKFSFFFATSFFIRLYIFASNVFLLNLILWFADGTHTHTTECRAQTHTYKLKVLHAFRG